MKNKNAIILSGTLVLSIIIYFIDNYFGGRIFTFLSSNMIIKILTIFLTLGGIIGLFHPFTFKKEISKTDVSEISKKAYEELKEKDRINQRIINQAKF